ncbi:unnamed protein product [Laminaria digitata]
MYEGGGGCVPGLFCLVRRLCFLLVFFFCVRRRLPSSLRYRSSALCFVRAGVYTWYTSSMYVYEDRWATGTKENAVLRTQTNRYGLTSHTRGRVCATVARFCVCHAPGLLSPRVVVIVLLVPSSVDWRQTGEKVRSS